MNMNQNESEPSGGIAAAVAPVETSTSQPDLRGYVERSLAQLRAGAWPTLKYLAETEVHTYAFSVAACAVLSFVPAIVMMGTIIRLVLHSKLMLRVLLDPTAGIMVRYLPTWDGKDIWFIINNLNIMIGERRSIQIMSLIMLLISATGVFEPLEVALNKVWGFKANRSYLMNQVVSLGLAFGCTALALASVALTSGLQTKATTLLPGDSTHVNRPVDRARSKRQNTQSTQGQQKASQTSQPENATYLSRVTTKIHLFVNWVIIRFCGLLTSIAMFFLIYWLLPNGKVNPWDVLPAAAVTGVILEIARYIYILVALPLLDFHEAYGPFSTSVTLIFWSFTAGLLLLGGAHLSAYGRTQEKSAE